MPMTGLLTVIFLALCLVVTSGAKSEETETRNCGGLNYSCEELVELGFTYPFSREYDSYLFVNGAVYPYRKITDHLLDDSVVRLPDRTEVSVRKLLTTFGLDSEMNKSLVPVIGYGSDPAPSQLRRKFIRSGFRGDAVIPVIKGRLRDYDIVWSPFFVSYGAMPSTITPSPGTDVEIWVTWLDEETVGRMNSSEGTGELYALGWLRDVQFELEGPKPKEMLVYVSCFGALRVDGTVLALASVPATKRTWRPVDSASALRAVMSKLGWHGSVLDLLYANVTSPSGRAERTRKIKGLGVLTKDPHFYPVTSCGSKQKTGGGRF